MVEFFAPRLTTPPRDRLDYLHLTESLGYGIRSVKGWHACLSQTHALALHASWTVARTLHTAAYDIKSDLRKLDTGTLMDAPLVKRDQVTKSRFTRGAVSPHTPLVCPTVLHLSSERLQTRQVSFAPYSSNNGAQDQYRFQAWRPWAALHVVDLSGFEQRFRQDMRKRLARTC